jgi:hypothetical protein
MWPRRKTTRGGEADDGETEDSAIEDKDIEPSNTTAGAEQNQGQPPPQAIKQSSSFEARMAEEGRKLLAAEGRSVPQSSTTPEAVRRRQPALKSNNSTEDLRVPGRFQ